MLTLASTPFVALEGSASCGVGARVDAAACATPTRRAWRGLHLCLDSGLSGLRDEACSKRSSLNEAHLPEVRQRCSSARLPCTSE